MLDPLRHARIVQDLEGVCSRAGITRQALTGSAVEHCSEQELAWLRDYHTNVDAGNLGLRLLGKNGLNRCMALTGALVRNYIDARVRTVDQLIEDPVDATVLCCPNFYLQGQKNMPAWRVQKLYDILLERLKSGHSTVVWLDDANGVKDYGSAMADLLLGFQSCTV
jgi:hypothetical protein